MKKLHVLENFVQHINFGQTCCVGHLIIPGIQYLVCFTELYMYMYVHDYTCDTRYKYIVHVDVHACVYTCT